MSTVQTIRTELPHDYVRATLDPHRAWIEQTLGVPFGEAVIADLSQAPLHHLVVREVFGRGGLASGNRNHWGSGLRIERYELREGEPCLLHLTAAERRSPAGRSRVVWRAEWIGQPVALWFRGLERPVVFLRLRWVDPDERGGTSTGHFVIARREDLPAFTALLARHLRREKTRKNVFILNGPDQEISTALGWDDLVLEDHVVRLIRSDFETFFQRRDWFRENRIPYRRGYLFHGPPGNGKTSVVRVLAARPELSICSLQWGDSDVDDSMLTHLFQWAADHAPAMIVMEDLDRHFPADGGKEKRHRITLSHLMNSLDGLSTAEGVIVVATANDAAVLDDAILRRPGRFDRVVEFRNPGPELRGRFIRKSLRGGCPERELEDMVRLSAGFSFAQLREAYVLAGQLAYEHGRGVCAEDMHQALKLMRETRRGGGGFAPEKLHVGYPAS